MRLKVTVVGFGKGHQCDFFSFHVFKTVLSTTFGWQCLLAIFVELAMQWSNGLSVPTVS